MSDTPRTDRAFEGDLSVGVLPEVKTFGDAKDFARHLERELNEVVEARNHNLACVEKLGKECIELRTEVDRLRKDQDRLSWLSQFLLSKGSIGFSRFWLSADTSLNLRDSIDKAMLEEKESN